MRPTTNQPTNQPTNQTTNQPTKQTSKQASKQANKQASKQANKQTNKQTTNQPNKQTNKQTTTNNNKQQQEQPITMIRTSLPTADVALPEVEDMNTRLASAQGAQKETTKRVSGPRKQQSCRCFFWLETANPGITNLPPKKDKECKGWKKSTRSVERSFLLMVACDS